MTLRPVLVPVPQSALPRSAACVTAQQEAARRALACCARRCGAPLDGWEKNAEGAPRPNGAYHWSVSHKRLWAAAVISDQPVGIDLEAIAPRKRRLHDELADEVEWTLLGNRTWASFFRLWTAKEATLKAHGVGIGALKACRLVAVPDERHMILEYRRRRRRIEHYEHANHVAAVTCDSEAVEWCVCAEPSKGDPACRAG